MKKKISAIAVSLLLACLLTTSLSDRPTFAAVCVPTEEDIMGPFYKPNAPLRSNVGSGYVLQGIVRKEDCNPIPGAIIEFWLAGPDITYNEAHRATVIIDSTGRYRFESNVPPPIEGRPPHIHLRVSAKDFKTLVTQHYPVAGKNEAVFDVVLVPTP